MRLFTRLRRLPGQLLGECPFPGTLRVERLPVVASALATVRHFRTPLRILDHVFRGDGDLKYLDVPGFPTILFVRDPEVIRAVTVGTMNHGDFDRDTLPTQGIARVVGGRNLLFAQGEIWRKHRAAAARVFGAGTVQTPDVYRDMEQAIRRAVEPQIEELAERVRRSRTGTVRMQLEPSIQALMLNVLVNVLFGSSVPHAELREKYLPAIGNVIRYILLDTVANQLRFPVFRIPALTRGHARLKHDRLVFEELVDRVIRTRSEGAGFWPLLTAEGPEEAIRSNVRVFLAGALEATSSYLGWALANLARQPAARAAAHAEAVRTTISPEGREAATYLQQVLAETLRLNNSLYFLPRVAVRDTTVSTPAGWLAVPAGTHLVLATYHAGRCERHWGVAATGYPAAAFVPERWDAGNMAGRGRSSKDNLHFGFGHGPRVCIGKHFSEVEAFVCLMLFLRRFEFRAVREASEADAGVSTRPRDGVDLELSLRFAGPPTSAGDGRRN
jgi:cytochrome P450